MTRWAEVLDRVHNAWMEDDLLTVEEAQDGLHVLLNQVALHLTSTGISREAAMDLVASYMDGWTEGEGIRDQVPDPLFVSGMFPYGVVPVEGAADDE